MKNLFNFRLLVLIGVLITSLTTQMWGATITVSGNSYFYFDKTLYPENSGSTMDFTKDGAHLWFKVWGGTLGEKWYLAKLVNGDVYGAKITDSGTFSSCQIVRKDPKNDGNADATGAWTYTATYTDMTSTTNYRTASSWGQYRPPVSSFTLTPTFYNHGGDGLSSETPYLIPIGTNVSFEVSSVTESVTDDSNMELQYQFKENDATIKQQGTTASYTYTASTTPGTAFSMKVYVYNRYQNGDGGNANQQIYFKTVRYYVSGNGTGNWCDGISWSTATDCPMTFDAVNGDWYITFNNVSASDNLIFAVTKGDWSGAKRYAAYNTSCGTNLTASDADDGDHNTKLAISNPSNITIRYDFSTEKICASAVPLYNNLAVTVSPAGAAADPTIFPTYTTQATNSVTITAADANGGYTWLGWTANGGTITTSSSQSTTWSPGASSKTATANYTENNYNVTITKTTGGSLSSMSTVTGHVSTSADLPVATPDVGYYFVNWTVTSGTAVITNPTSATDATINGMTADVTVQANFARTYAYIQGRMTVTDATRTTPTYVGGSDGEWNKSSTNVEMDYDGSSKVYYRHTYKTPAQLSETQNTNDPQYFSFKTCTSHGNIGTGTVTYEPSDNADLEYAGDEVAVSGSHDRHVKFNSSTSDGYAIIYFDESKVWYELEHTLTYDGNGNTSGSVSEAYYDHNATATVVAAGTFLRTGYTLTGWSGSDGNTYASGASITMTQNLTLTAQWSEDKHSVTVVKDLSAGGTISTTSVSGIGIDTYSGNIIATANTGYYFSGWTLDDGVTQHSLSTTNTQASSTSTITINATADSKTLTANFGVRYAIFGSLTDGYTPAGLPGWTTPQAFDAYDSEDSKYTLNLTELHPNTVYKLKVKDLRDGNSYGPQGESHIPDGAQWTLDGTVNTGYAMHFKTKGVGTYVLTTTETGTTPDQKPTAKIDMPTSYTVTYGQVTDNGQNGGSISTVVDNGGYALTSGDYVAAAGSATFTASAPTTGYSFIGWYTSSTYGEGTELSTTTPWTLSTPNENKTVYAHYAENLCTVTINANNSSRGSITVDAADFTWGNTTQVGVYTTKALVATPATGYYFAGWTLSDGAECTVGANMGEDYASVTLTGLGTTLSSTATLTARFEPLEKVYFRNWNEEANGGAGGALWENVYVYFSIDYENGKEGTSCAKTNGSEGYKAQMTLESDNVYWAYVPRATTRSGNDDIAFSNTSYGEGIKFYMGEGVMRSDYRTSQSMFVPRHASNYTRNDTKYYNGYWKHHNVDPGKLSGYSIERYKGSDPIYEPAADNGVDKVHFIVENENTIRYSLRVDNPSAAFNNYMIYSDGAISYITYDGVNNPAETGNTITTTNYSRVPMSEYDTGNPRFCITPTTQNLYTLTIDMSGDEMKLTVDYPVALGDYRLKHQTYTVRNHTNTADSAVYSYSDIIKSANAGSAVIASMYINKDVNKANPSDAGTNPTLILEKCTDIDPVTWKEQSQGSVWSTYSGSFDKNGVYQFDVTLSVGNTDLNSTINNIQNIKIYEGEFYIKTDCAPGGWTAWKANVMEKNTITFNSADSKTFDRSFCHWIDAVRGSDKPMNVKCVIANDYNIAVSDTLVGDAILGNQGDGKPWENIPSAAHVRFSYNSTTNVLKRTYLSLAGENKLQLEGNTVSSASMIRNTDGTTFTNNATTLTALSNFTYKVDVQAREKARVRLTSIYQSNNQSLVGTFTSTGSDLDGADNAKTVEVLGGNTSNTGYKTMRIIYDFKTNYVMAAWLVDADVNVDKDTALQADLMIIRQEQGDAYQLTFGDNKSMTEVKNVYGVMKFTQSFITNSSESRYKRDLYWISFPFDVKLSDAFGMGTYGIHWIVERYDGYTRARKGFWADSPSNWKFITPYQRDSGFVMKANEGYILALDLDELGDGSLVWDNGKTDAYLYFPSDGNVGTITQEATKVININQDGYQCTINRATGTEGDRRIKDSYWHCIGAPSYANVSHSISNPDEADDAANWNVDELWTPAGLLFFYNWDSETNTLSVEETESSKSFKAMHSYLVQYSNSTITWTNVNKAPAPVAARVMKTPDITYNLALLREDEEQDHTYVRLTDEDGITNRFEFNQDLSKEYNAGKANIWTVTADTVQVAGNSMPKPLQTTLVPVGVKVVANGEYTFSMPEGTNGGDVWLIDNANSSRTNLGLMDYTINLTTGTYEGRFSLEFPVQNVVTDIDNAANANANANADVRKVFVGGRLYILRDGKAYDATGAQVR